MVTAIVFIRADVARIPEVAEAMPSRRVLDLPLESAHAPGFFLMRGVLRPNFEVPARAAWLRLLLAEHTRLLSHLGFLTSVADGIRAYEAGQHRQALAFYEEAQGLAPADQQLRIRNGLYLANQALGRDREAEEAFGSVVDYGLERGRLAVKFVFRPGSTAFWPDPAISGPYPMWLRQIASRTEARSACLEVEGHTSPTGSAGR